MSCTNQHSPLELLSGGLNLSRAIGDHAYKKTANLPAEEQAITALPDIRTLTLEDQDEFMIIACDGIWNFMSSQDVVDYVHARLDKKTPAEICEEVSRSPSAILPANRRRLVVHALPGAEYQRRWYWL